MFEGDVPDIGGIQSWIEKSWKAGFDVPGGEEFGNILSGTQEWIGATECAALLRYFGIRAIVVDFSMNQEERKNRTAKLKETLARRNKTIYNKNRKRKKNDEYYPPKKNVKCKSSVISHNQSTTLDALVDMNGCNDRQIDISDSDNDYDNDNDNDDFQNDDVVTFQNGRNGIEEHSLRIKDDISHKNIPSNDPKDYQNFNTNKKISNSDHSKIEEKSVSNNMENEKDLMSERVFNWVQKYHSLNMVITDAGSVMLGGNTSKCHLEQSVKVSRNSVINIDTEEDGDFNNNHNYDDNNDSSDNKYDNHSNNNGNNNNYNYNRHNNVSNNMNSLALEITTESSTSSSQIMTNDALKQKANVLPLFFQHQGHSRTIVGEISF